MIIMEGKLQILGITLNSKQIIVERLLTEHKETKLMRFIIMENTIRGNDFSLCGKIESYKDDFLYASIFFKENNKNKRSEYISDYIGLCTSDTKSYHILSAYIRPHINNVKIEEPNLTCKEKIVVEKYINELKIINAEFIKEYINALRITWEKRFGI